MSLELKEAIKIAKNQLADAGIHDAENDAKELYCHLMGLDRVGLMMRWTEIIQDNRIDAYFDLIARRAAHTPLQHITGTQEFMGMTFKVNENVLIPRMDTETLVHEAVKYLETGGEVLDVGTGSGAIGISIAKLCPRTKVTLSDISDAALETAKENAALNKVKVKAVQSDILSAFKGKLRMKKFDMIISNPPYIATDVISGLEPEVKDHEPMLALDGGADGLDFYRAIAKDVPNHLKKDGMLMLEIGYDQGETVPMLLDETGCFDRIEIIKDISGNDRVVSAHFSGHIKR